MISSPTEARQQVDRDVEAAQRRVAAARAARVGIEAVRGNAATRAGDVALEVDSGGSIVSLDLTSAALTRRPADLSAAILQTMRQAQAQVVEQVAAIAADTFGADTATTRRIRGQLDGQFVKPDPDDGVLWGTGGRSGTDGRSGR